MSNDKRYYWLKLKDDFFDSKRIKKLRKVAGGDTFTIIYLKMQLLSLKSEGILTFTGLENSFAEELALDLDEDVENVGLTLGYLQRCGLIETSNDIDFFLPYTIENTGSEKASAQRQREFRARQKASLICDNVTLGCDNVTSVSQVRNAEIEKEKDIEIEKEKKSVKKAKVDVFAEYAKEKKDLLEALKDFEEMRKKIKKPMTDRAKSLLVNKLNEFPESQRIAILNQSIEHSWVGIYELHEQKGKGNTSGYDIDF